MKTQISERKDSKFNNFKKRIGISGDKFFSRLQFLGKAMVFPIIALPIGALLLRFGNLLSDTSIGFVEEQNWIWYIGQVLSAMGQPVFTYLPIIFAIGISFGLAKENRGEVALAGAIATIVLQSLLGENVLASIFYSKVMIYHKTGDDDLMAAIDGMSQLLYMVNNGKAVWGLDLGVFAGIVSGCWVAFMYNRWSTIKLPQALSFFEGKRFICILAILTMLFWGILFAVIWPWIQLGLINLGMGLIKIGYIGTFLHTLLKSILVLFGLHQVLNTFLWFQLPITGEALFTNGEFIAGQIYTVNGDINAFLAGINGAGLFQIGSFPEIMGGYWGITFAIILAAKKEHRKEVAGLMISICAVSSLTGVGEPLILPIWYASPLIYLFQSVLNAIFGTIPAAMGIRAGFGFSAGWVDYAISFWTSFKMSQLSSHSVLANPLWLIPIAVLTAASYFVVFYYLIKLKDLKTLGRDDNFSSISEDNKDDKKIKDSKNKITKNKTNIELIKNLIAVIGKDNVVKVSNCATRLRLEVKDNQIISDDELKKLKVFGYKKIGQKNIQIIIGNGVEQVADDFEKEVFKK
ncbi:PTS transporter subunit EIIC [Mesoplasma florum]|uniref:PTS transporter subunit EIIC n=1 Tax=Mesoplasma florum TaxID=2151 RepID=UPI000D02B2F6|nr:PTS transporter subunit EIIC [Mesoplasma florum]AVN59108.1 PTS sugar transporter subunit IIA [Mesoplasma florum]